MPSTRIIVSLVLGEGCPKRSFLSLSDARRGSHSLVPIENFPLSATTISTKRLEVLVLASGLTLRLLTAAHLKYAAEAPTIANLMRASPIIGMGDYSTKSADAK